VKISASLVLLATTLEVSSLRLNGQTQAVDDDVVVLAAVIEHTVLPAVRRQASGLSRTPLALVRDQSIPLCKERRSGLTRCHIPESWRRFLVPDAMRNWAGLVQDERIRMELVKSLEARNTEPHRLPMIAHPQVTLIESGVSAVTPEKYRQSTVGLSSLSLPGYAAGRYALVYGSYSCGGLCGYAWLFVLEKVDGQWRVKSSSVTSIS
jgi:hypothetical protein